MNRLFVLEIVPIANQEIKLASIAIVCVQLTRTLFYLAAVLWFGSVRALLVSVETDLHNYLVSRWFGPSPTPSMPLARCSCPL